MRAIKVIAIKRRLALITPPDEKLPSMEWQARAKQLEGGVGESSAEVRLVIRRTDTGKLILDVQEGGVTGYENCYLGDGPGDAHIEDLIERGWLANAGTIGRWDSLYIPGASIQLVVTAFLFSEVAK